MILTHIARFLRAWRRYNHSVRELSQLSDRELADIGLTRSEIQVAAWDAAHTQTA